MKYLLTILIVLGFFLSNPTFGQCDGGDPTTNNPTSFNTSISIEENFNNARRWEETDLGLTPNCLGNMVAPAGGWASLDDDQTALYIHNSERTARGILPLFGVEVNLDNVAQNHSDWQINNNVFSHGGDPALGSNNSYALCSDCSTGITGSSPFDRMNQSAPLAGQWQTESENLASNVTSGSSILDFVARGIYRFIYQDAGSGWGHRHNVLRVYTNDWGDAATEGFIGVGVAGGNSYTSCGYGCNNWNFAKILTIDYYDPQGSASGYSFSTLPVELLSFEGYKNEKTIDIKWTVYYLNISYFELQKSTDGNNFSSIALIDFDNYLENAQYMFTDESPSIGTNLYRLVTVDFDGNKSVSKTITINYSVEESIKVYPNPFEKIITLNTNFKSDKNNLVIYNVKGTVVFEETVLKGNNSQKINLSSFDKGIYFMKVKNPHLERIIKLIKIK
ncbi:MAG TPA: T9SS type A sorting domain-containing protein [Bacteroidetes bacterium]|nr:T9SS type A sorting domain-containing protein [Bacteroidota bacterium]